MRYDNFFVFYFVDLELPKTLLTAYFISPLFTFIAFSCKRGRKIKH